MGMRKLLIGIILLLGLIIDINGEIFANQKHRSPGIRSVNTKSTQAMLDRMQKKRNNDKVNKLKVSLDEVFGPQVIMEDNYGIEFDLTFSNNEKKEIAGTAIHPCCGNQEIKKGSYKNKLNFKVISRTETCEDGGICVGYKYYNGKPVENERGLRQLTGDWKNDDKYGAGRFRMWPKGISGIVENATGIPINATVTIVDLKIEYTTDSNGFYQFVDVPVGTYTITASADGYQESSQSVTVTVTEKGNQVDFSLTPISTGNITGVVSDANTGVGISGATVSTNAGGSTTDSNGSYTLSNVAAGTYDLTASKDGYNSETVSGVTVTAGGTTSVNFSLTPELGILTLSKDTAYLLGDTIVATVVDADRNTNSTAAEILTTALKVTGSNYFIGTDLDLDLVETGVNSGTFLATIETGTVTTGGVGSGGGAAGSGVNYGILLAIQGGIASVIYTDTSLASTTNTLSFSSFDAILYFDKDTYSLDSYALVTLIDAEMNTNIISAQFLLADVFIQTSILNSTIIRMVETGVDTGTFQGSIKIASTGGTTVFSQIQAAEGDTLTISYFDVVNTTVSLRTVTDTASVLNITPPSVISVSPSDGATGVAVSTTITATFSERMD